MQATELELLDADRLLRAIVLLSDEELAHEPAQRPVGRYLVRIQPLAFERLRITVAVADHPSRALLETLVTLRRAAAYP